MDWTGSLWMESIAFVGEVASVLERMGANSLVKEIHCLLVRFAIVLKIVPGENLLPVHSIAGPIGVNEMVLVERMGFEFWIEGLSSGRVGMIPLVSVEDEEMRFGTLLEMLLLVAVEVLLVIWVMVGCFYKLRSVESL